MKEKIIIVYGEMGLEVKEPVVKAVMKKLITEKVKPLFIDDIVKAWHELKSKGDVYASYIARLYPSFFKVTIRVFASANGIVTDEVTITYDREFQGDKLYEIVSAKLRPYQEIEEFYIFSDP